MQTNSIIKLLGLQDLLVNKFEDLGKYVVVHASTKSKKQVCPCCHEHTSAIHDYRLQKIKHIMVGKKQSFIYLKKRRYLCLSCGKRFYEQYHFISKYYRNSNTLINNVFDDLKRHLNFKEIAKSNGISSQSVIRLLQFTAPFKVVRELPAAIRY